MDVKIDKLWSVKKSVFSCPLVRGAGPSTHCSVLKIALFINQCSHKIALFTWFGLFSIHFKAYEVTLIMADGRSAVGGRPIKVVQYKPSIFLCPPITSLYRKPMWNYKVNRLMRWCSVVYLQYFSLRQQIKKLHLSAISGLISAKLWENQNILGNVWNETPSSKQTNFW